MQGGAAGGARSRPPTVSAQGVSRSPLHTLVPSPNAVHPTFTKVTKSLVSTYFSTFGMATPSSDQVELLSAYSKQLLCRKKNKMDQTKLKPCITDSIGCCPSEAQRQMLENVTSIMQPLSIKTEQIKRSCNTCVTSSPKKVSDSGCSRTNPVAWVGVAGQNMQVQVKREPQHMQCVSELVAVKMEQASPGNKSDLHSTSIPASLNNGSIPVGIAVARQRVENANLIAAFSQKDTQQRMHDIEGTQAAMTVGVAGMGGTLLHCDDRAAPLSWQAPPAPATPLWQYPTAQVSMDGMMMGGMSVGGMGPVGGGMGSMGSMGGFQLVREPTSGALLLLPTAPPDLSHTVVWGGVGYPSAPLLLPPAPHPPHHLQLLPGDLLASTATLQHTHTHSTRLVTLAPAPPPQHTIHTTDKRKPMIQPMMTPHALIKIEADVPHEKPQPTYLPDPIPPPQPMLAPQPMMAPQMYYQPEYPAETCRSRATSPVPLPPTPPLLETHDAMTRRDASNQTDHVEDEDESPNHADDDDREIACVGVAHSPSSDHIPLSGLLQPSIIDSNEESSSDATSAVGGAVAKAIDAIERDEALVDNNSSGSSQNLVIDSGKISPEIPTRAPVDVSGLELLSNSIEQFERTTPSMPIRECPPLTIDTRPPMSIIIKTSPKSPPRTEAEPQRRFQFPSNEEERNKPSFDGLGLLCALAEQRFREEVKDCPSTSTKSLIKSENSTRLSQSEKHKKFDSSSRDKKEKHRHRDGDSSSERRHKRNREERLRHKLEKIKRHKREKEQNRNSSELQASLKRVTACSCAVNSCKHNSVPSAEALVNAIEKDMRKMLQDLERQCVEKRAQLHALSPPMPAISTPPTPSTPVHSPDSDRSSSQKRKVGRPRKVSSPDSTETIVAKKPKSKSSLVGYLLAKGRLKGGILCSRGEPSREDSNRTSKIRPKLKAEPIVKAYSEEEEGDWGLNRSASSSMESLNEIRLKNREKTDRLARKHSRDDFPEIDIARRVSPSSDSDKERRRAKKRRKSVKSKERSNGDRKGKDLEKPKVTECTLTEELIDKSPRVLTAMGGLFYAGKLSAVEAPDVYAITLDGERGNKPHILSREETLKDAILEVSPSSVKDLTVGTRVCAYWSQQYRCLYPGTVAEAASMEATNLDKFVAVEFDDGDSGTIAIEDIRLLEPNYPVVEYENPLFTLGKRRRNASVHSIEDKRNISGNEGPIAGSSNDNALPKPSSESEERHKDRKKLKKHRKDKLKRHSSEDDPNATDYVKKKKKKHKCCEDHCKHRRHHKKHYRKHRKRHSSSSGDDNYRHKSSSEYGDSNKSNDDSVDSNEPRSTLVACEKSPEEKMKTVIKKAVLCKKSLINTSKLDFSSRKFESNKIEAKNVSESNSKDNDADLDSAAIGDSPKKKIKRRTMSCASLDNAGVSKMAAFLPGAALWRWSGAAYRRTARPRHKKLFYRAIQRAEETLSVGDAAVFLSTGRPDRPYIGRIVSLWEARGAMAVKVNWFYHPEETVGCAGELLYPGGLFESPHTDENDVQTISHKCEVLSLAQYKERMSDDPNKYRAVYDNNDVYYLAGNYDPTQQTITMQPDIPFAETPTAT